MREVDRVDTVHQVVVSFEESKVTVCDSVVFFKPVAFTFSSWETVQKKNQFFPELLED